MLDAGNERYFRAGSQLSQFPRRAHRRATAPIYIIVIAAENSVGTFTSAAFARVSQVRRAISW